MFGFGKKSKDKKSKKNKEVSLTEEEESKDVIPEDVIVVKKRNIPVSPYITPYPFTECPPKILTGSDMMAATTSLDLIRSKIIIFSSCSAYASSVYNANEGRLLTIEMEKVSNELN